MVSTLAGTLVGVGSTLLVDRARFSRDQRQQWQQARREVYVDFLTEVSRTYESLWALGLGEYLGDQPRAAAARQILRTGEIYQARQRLVIVASWPVIEACEATFSDLKLVRDVLGAGNELGSPEFVEANKAFRSARERFLEAIRKDLGIDEPGGTRSQLPSNMSAGSV